MNTISQSEVNSVTSAYTAQETTKKSKVTSGAVIGAPELSEKAQKYYEQLKKKFSNMDFILVSMDQKANAAANASQYANANRMVVLVDTEKIERMAEDEAYRKQIEGVISGAAVQMSQLQTSLGSSGASVKSYGMQVNDGGTASFFAVIDKSLAAQKERIEKNAAKKAEEKKADEKKADEKKAQQKQADQSIKQDEQVTITANSIEELLQKINDTLYESMSDYVCTDQENSLGQHVDFLG